MTVGVIIQARTGSTRLPAKILKPLPYNSNWTVLDQVIRRVKKSKLVEKIIVATTKNEKDNEIINIAENHNVLHFRGSENDVLERYYCAAKKYKVDTVVRVTSDCPCIDWTIIDQLIKKFKENYDYVSNALTRTYPHGVAAEVFSFQALEKAFNEATLPEFREHVTPFMYKSNKFKIFNLKAPPNLTAPNIRVTLDTIEDYALLCAVFDFLYYKNKYFTTKDVIEFFNKKSWLYLINQKVVQKKIFDSLEEELKETLRVLELLDLNRAKDFLHNIIEELLKRATL